MRVRYANADLQRLETDLAFTAKFSHVIVKAYRKRMQLIRAAQSEQDFRNLKSLHFEKLKGNRQRQWSLRLNDQWRLILEFERDEDGKVVVIVSIEDYH